MLEAEGFLEMLMSINKLAWHSISELGTAQIEQQFFFFYLKFL
jgi:hypothetical protein